jgi:outer membrane immunogenic protein
MRSLLAALLCTACGVSVAAAADLPARNVYKAAPMVAPAFSWTGWYAGVNLGYGWGSERGTGTIAGSALPINGAFSSNTRFSGVAGGGQIGYNWQANALVFGIEADLQGTTERKQFTAGCGVGCAVSVTDSLPAFGTIRGRLGFAAWNRGLIYVTGGGAWLDAHTRATLTDAGGTAAVFNSNNDKFGWTLGGGAEWMVWDRWSVKAEYLYMQANNVATTAAIPAALGGGTVTSGGRLTNNVARLGLNFHF